MGFPPCDARALIDLMGKAEKLLNPSIISSSEERKGIRMSISMRSLSLKHVRVRSILLLVFSIALMSNMAGVSFTTSIVSASSMDTSQSSPRALYDVNGDGIINKLDLSVLAIASSSYSELTMWRMRPDLKDYNLVFAGTMLEVRDYDTSVPTGLRRLWSENSYWHMKIPENAPLHPDSAKMVEWLKGPGSNYQNGHVIVNWQKWTKALYDAYEDTPKVTVYKSDGVTVRFYNVPIDPLWEAASDTDHSMGIIDWFERKYYDFWNIFYERGVWKSGAGYVYDLDSTGVAPNRVWTVGGSSTPMLALAIRDEEIEAGVINHPLGCCLHTPKKGVKVYPPAATTDGKSWNTYAIPVGARIQLDPSLDLDSLGLSRTARIIAKAMQEYGIVVKESGGAWAIYAEHTLSANWGSDMSNGVVYNLPTDMWRIVDYSVFGATEEPYP